MRKECTNLHACERGHIGTDPGSCQILPLSPLPAVELGTPCDLLHFKRRCPRHDGMKEMSEIRWD